MKRIFQVLRLTRSHHKRLYLAVLVNLVLTVLMIVPPYMTKLLFDYVYPNRDETLLYVVLLSIALFACFSDLITQVKDYFVSFLNMSLSLGTNFEFYHHVSELDISFFNNRRVGEITSRAKDALESVGGIMQVASSFIMNSITLIIFPPILLYINWKLALLSLAVIPFDLVISYFISKHVAAKTRITSEINAEVNARKFEFLSGMRTIQALGVEQEVFNGIKDATIESTQIRIRMIFWQRVASFTINALRAVSVLFYGWYGWTSILSGNMSLGTYMAFTAYSGYLRGPIRGLLGLVSRIQVLLVHIDRFTEIYDLEPEIKTPPVPIRISQIYGHIFFQNVSFSYDANRPTLRNLNLEVEPGKVIGIVGPSGAGKTTLVQLIPRFYDPIEGAVCIDGYDTRQLDLQELRGQISYMQQEAFIFSGSIFDNIAIGDVDTDAARVEAAARKACIHEVISSLEQGYNTQVGERGSLLSQGQKQRIALARVLIRSSPIVILDEATSSLEAV